MLAVQFAWGQNTVPRDSLAADFRQFVHWLEETHPDPYSAFGGKVFFHRKAGETARELQSKDYTLQDFGLLLNRFIAPLGDGHTSVYLVQQKKQGGGLYFPFGLRVIPDGLILSAVPEGQKAYLGSRVLEVDGVTVEELGEKMAQLAPCENLYGKYVYLSQILPALEFMQKLIPARETVTLRLLTPQGKEEDWKVEAVARGKRDSLIRVHCPVWERTADMGNIEWRFLDEKQQVAYFRLKSVMAREAYAYMKENGWDGWEQQVAGYYRNYLHREVPADGEAAVAGIPAMSQEFRQMLEVLKKAGSSTLIIDLRGNGGGFTPITLPTIYQLYGDRYLQTDMEAAFYRLISPLYMQKNNTTLADFNREHGSSYAFGDYQGDEEAETEAEVPVAEQRERFLNQCIGDGAERIRDLEGRPVYTPRHVFVVTNANTFSAAFHYAFYLWRMGATVVGVPCRQAPNTFMEQTPFRLPRTGIEGSISNSAQYFLPPADRRARTFYPDWMPAYEDYVKYGFDADTEIRYLLDRAQRDGSSVSFPEKPGTGK